MKKAGLQNTVAEIRTKRVRKQKTDRQDAQLLLRLMMEDRFPRIWIAAISSITKRDWDTSASAKKYHWVMCFFDA